MKLRYLLPLLGSAVLLTACNEDKAPAAVPEQPAAEQTAPATSNAAPATNDTASAAGNVAPAANSQSTTPAAESPAANTTEQQATTAEPVHMYYKDSITGNEYKSYSFKGHKGQKVTANLKAQGDASVFLYGYDDFVAGEPYTLPDDAMYEIRVVQPRNSARKNETSSFELDVDVK